jgi:hypothetical protein
LFEEIESRGYGLVTCGCIVGVPKEYVEEIIV